MKTCKVCGSSFTRWITIGGKARNLSNRTKCLDCLPFKSERPKRSKEAIRLGNAKAAREKYARYKAKHGKGPVSVRRAKRRNRVVELSGGCQFCGYNRTSYNIAFHHCRGKKMFRLDVRAFSKKLKDIAAELKKTVAACHNCHGEIHVGLIPGEVVIKAHSTFYKKLAPLFEDWGS